MSGGRPRGAWRWLPLLAVAACSHGSCGALAQAACAAVAFEGEVTDGHSYTQALTPQLDWKLEAVPAGWMVRVLPHGGARPLHDAAELANPPYRSPTPILVSTDFAFRAQDAIAWNPRRFRFFTSAEQVKLAEGAYQATLREPGRPSAGAPLFSLLARAGQGTLTIADAQIAGGTANQAAAAATVASHFEQTAHTLRTDLPPTPLGRILLLRFRVEIAAGELCR